MLLCQDFVKFDVSTNQNHSRGNSKVSNFLHSDVFTAFWSFPSYPDHHLTLVTIMTENNLNLNEPLWPRLDCKNSFCNFHSYQVIY